VGHMLKLIRNDQLRWKTNTLKCSFQKKNLFKPPRCCIWAKQPENIKKKNHSYASQICTQSAFFKVKKKKTTKKRTCWHTTNTCRS